MMVSTWTDKNQCPILYFSVYSQSGMILVENLTFANHHELLKRLAVNDPSSKRFNFADKYGGELNISIPEVEEIGWTKIFR
jgi:hypothetical protein